MVSPEHDEGMSTAAGLSSWLDARVNVNLAKLYARPGDKIFSKLLDVERSALQAKDLTQQLFTFSKGGAPVKKIMDTGNIVKDAAGFATRGSKSQCRFVIPEDLWFAEVNQGQINQVINNLQTS